MRVGGFVRFGSGLAAWSLAEYLTHRFPMHARRGSTPLADEHLDHHADPLDARPLRLDWHNLGLKGAGFALASMLMSPAFATGFTSGYAGYTHMHHEIHHRRPRSRVERLLWRRHHVHHFSAPAGNFGVTSALWDTVFGTCRFSVEPIAVAARRAPEWMEGDADYRIVRPML